MDDGLSGGAPGSGVCVGVGVAVGVGVGVVVSVSVGVVVIGRLIRLIFVDIILFSNPLS
jgi:hypothetical protein